MTPMTLCIVLLALSAVSYYLAKRRSLAVVGGPKGAPQLHSLPAYYGYLAAMWCAVPALFIVATWVVFGSNVITALVVADLPNELRNLPRAELGLLVNDLKNFISGNVVSRELNPTMLAAADHYKRLEFICKLASSVLVISVAIIGAGYSWRRITPKLRARNHVEKGVGIFLIVSSTAAIFTTIGIVLSVLFEAIRFFGQVPLTEFLFGLSWSPQMAIREDQVGSSGAFGAVPLFTGTLLISLIAMVVSVPVGLFSAIYLAEYANKTVRSIAKPALEVLAGIPTVVYGFFAALTVAPFLRQQGISLGLDVSSESALAAGVVMGIMIIPFISSISDDVINAVPQSLRDGSYGLGATKSETIKRVVLPAALPGIVGGILLAISRAIGETMIVVMAAGLSANLTANPLQSVTTVTVQIVTLLVGDQEFDSPKTLAAFALGLLLFAVTLALNVIALHVVRKYREQYE